MSNFFHDKNMRTCNNLIRFSLFLLISLVINKGALQVHAACSSCLMALPFGSKQVLATTHQQHLQKDFPRPHVQKHRHNVQGNVFEITSKQNNQKFLALGSVYISDNALASSVPSATPNVVSSCIMLFSRGVMFRVLDQVVLPKIQNQLRTSWKVPSTFLNSEKKSEREGTALDEETNEDLIPAQKDTDPVVSSMVLTIGFYKNFISPLLPPACRFQPTCSQYGVQAIEEFGPEKGVILTAWRILRCTPFGGRGYDPPKWPPVAYNYGSY